MEALIYRAALFCGMTSNAFKLGTVLTLGWFWVRQKGCALLFRGSEIKTVDFESILCASDPEVSQIPIPSFITHENGKRYYYAIRRSNFAGDIEHGLQAVVRIEFDSEGGLVAAKPNVVYGLKAEHTAEHKVELGWYYSSLSQQSEPVRFNIYGDSGTGEIDFENAITQTEYKGKGFYTCEETVSGEGRMAFTVKAVDEAGVEGPGRIIAIDIKSKDTATPVIAEIEAV